VRFRGRDFTSAGRCRVLSVERRTPAKQKALWNMPENGVIFGENSNLLKTKKISNMEVANKPE
jgi:hypothetical protein